MSIWEQALFEGDIKFRLLRENSKHLKEEHKNKKLKKKKAVMLARSKAKLLDILEAKDIT